jgi:hypothetical protein
MFQMQPFILNFCDNNFVRISISYVPHPTSSKFNILYNIWENSILKLLIMYF